MRCEIATVGGGRDHDGIGAADSCENLGGQAAPDLRIGHVHVDHGDLARRSEVVGCSRCTRTDHDRPATGFGNGFESTSGDDSGPHGDDGDDCGHADRLGVVGVDRRCEAGQTAVRSTASWVRRLRTQRTSSIKTVIDNAAEKAKMNASV